MTRIPTIMGQCTLTRVERLSGEKMIARLFESGKGGFVYPFRYVSLSEDDGNGEMPRVLISVPKKNHKRANRRNLLKRRIREAYRLNKHSFTELAAGQGRSVDLALIYTSKEIVAYDKVENAVKRILTAVGAHL